jgi:hypothetical protein
MQDTEIVARDLRLVENACDNVAGIGIQGKDEGLDEPFRKTMDETKEKKGDGITSESDPEVDGFEGDPAASRNGQHPGDLEC